MQVVDSSSRDPLPGAMDIHMQLLRTPIQRHVLRYTYTLTSHKYLSTLSQ